MVKKSSDPHYFNPRSPCGERPGEWEADDTGVLFQSTLSLRRATKALLRGLPVSPISIHALLAESDDAANEALAQSEQFQSTLSLRRATVYIAEHWNQMSISIHALLAESDRGFNR